MKDTRPKDFNLDALDNDLACMALIRALAVKRRIDPGMTQHTVQWMSVQVE